MPKKEKKSRKRGDSISRKTWGIKKRMENLPTTRNHEKKKSPLRENSAGKTFRTPTDKDAEKTLQFALNPERLSA